MEVTQIGVYSPDGPWKGFPGKLNAAETAFTQVIAAIRSKDISKLRELSDPKRGRDPQEFDRQSGAFFEQFGRIELHSVKAAYGADGLAIFFGEFRTTEASAFVPMVFAAEPDGSYKFLPARSTEPAYNFICEWFDSPWGPPKTGQPQYCNTSMDTKANYALPTEHRAVEKLLAPASTVHVRGIPFGAEGTEDLRSIFETLNSAGKQKDIRRAIVKMSRAGRERMTDWLQKAREEEKAEYARFLSELSPFFLFDASPLRVVYAHDAEKKVHVLYFTGRPPAWTNSSHVTSIDEVFKQDAALAEAARKDPFAGMLRAK